MNQPIPALRDPVLLRSLPGLVTETLSFAQADADGAAWDRLLAAAATPNPHFSRHVVGAHLQHGLAPADLRLLVVRRGETWLALLPFARRRLGWGRRASGAFISPFVTNATPLLAGAALEEAADALVAALGTAKAPLWLLPALSADSETARAIRQACARNGLAATEVSSFERAVLERRESYDVYAKDHLSANRRKGLKRQRARLDALGRVEVKTFEAGPGLASAVEAFLDLESRGWKGARGSALASHPGIEAFARDWFAEGFGPVRPRADVLNLDGRPIAISLALVCGRTAHLVKTAYDESLRACGPGLLLEDAIVRACHDTRFADRLDSASLAGHVLEGFYPDRERIADMLIGAGGHSAASLARIADEEHRRREIMARLKGLYRRVEARVRGEGAKPEG